MKPSAMKPPDKPGQPVSRPGLKPAVLALSALAGALVLLQSAVSGHADTPTSDLLSATADRTLQIYNRTCGSITVNILSEGMCAPGISPCQLDLVRDARGDVAVTGALPAALTYQVDGTCTGVHPAVISGRCEVSLVTFTPRHKPVPLPEAGLPPDAVPSVDAPTPSLCADPAGGCNELTARSLRNRMRESRFLSVNIETGLCDVTEEGVDHCVPRCRPL